MSMARFIWVALAVWCASVFGLGAAGAFVGPPGRPPLALVAGAMLPLVVFGGAYRGSRAFRDFVLTADLRLVTAFQGWRWAGFGLLSLWTHGVLPGLFAWVAGLGDMAVGFTAPWIVLALARDRAFAGTRRFALFNSFGILDLVVALGLGGASAVLLRSDVTTAAMAQLPEILIPAFMVPLFLMLHVTSLLQAQRAAAAMGSSSSRSAPAVVESAVGTQAPNVAGAP
jgi:hypothetical protein